MTENLKEALSYAVELAGKEKNILTEMNMTYRSLILVSTHLSLSFRHSRV